MKGLTRFIQLCLLAFYAFQIYAQSDDNYKELNEVLSVAKFALDGPITFEQFGAQMDLSSILCERMSFQDLVVKSAGTNTERTLSIDIQGFALRCSATWYVQYAGKDEIGSVDFRVSESDLFLEILFASNDFSKEPPHKSELAPAPRGCSSKLGVEELKFDNKSLLSGILNMFAPLVKSFMEDMVGDMLCEMAPGMTNTTLTSMLQNISKNIMAVDSSKRNFSGDDILRTIAHAENKARDDFPNRTLIKISDSSLVQEGRTYLLEGLGLPTRAQVKQNLADISINNIMRSFLGDGNATNPNSSNALLHVPVDMMIMNGVQAITDSTASSLINITSFIQGVEIRGLDTFYVFNLFEPAGAFTLLTDLGLEHVSFTFDLEFNVGVSPKDRIAQAEENTASLTENFALTLGARDVTLSMGLMSAIFYKELGALQLGSLYEAPAECASSVIARIAMTHFLLDVDRLETPEVSGLWNQHVDDSMTSILDAIFSMYQAALLVRLPALSDATVRSMFNESVTALLGAGEGACPDMRRPAWPPTYVNFQTNTIFQLAKSILDTTFVAPAYDGRPNINMEYIDFYTENQSGTEGMLWYLQDEYEMAAEIPGIFDELKFRIGNLKIENIEINELTILEPKTKYLLENAFIAASKRPLLVSVDLYIKAESKEKRVENDFTLGLSLDTIRFALETVLLIDSSKLEWLRLAQLGEPACYATFVDTFIVQRMATKLNSASAHITCRKCTSPGIAEFMKNLRSENASYFSTEQLNAHLSKIADYVSSDRFGAYLNATLEKASADCSAAFESNWQMPTAVPTPSPTTAAEYAENLAEETSKRVGIAMISVTGIASCTIAAAFIFAVRKERRLRATAEYKEWHATLQQCKIDLCASTQSLFTSPVVPSIARYSIPVCICINICLFISAHLSLGATVNIIVSFAGERIEILNYVEFSIAKSILDAFSAGAYMLAFIILLFSGLWPYIKMFTMLWTWFAPTRYLSPPQRGKILRWMDVLGKWSMIDIFVLVMTLVAFRMRVVSPENIVLLPKEFYVIDLYVVPVWGLYANLLAQLLSQVVSHFAMHYHRNVVANAGYHYLNTGKSKSVTPKDVEMIKVAGRKPDAHFKTRSVSWLEIGTETARGRGRSVAALSWLTHGTDNAPLEDCIYHKESLCSHVFDRTRRARIQMKPWLRHAVCVLLLCTVFMLFYGCAAKSFRIEIQGLVGIVMNFGVPGSSRNEYSVFDIAAEVVRQTGDTFSSKLGLNCLAIVFIGCALIVPAVQMIAVLTLFSLPMTLLQQKQMLILNEILAAWQYLEVYLIALIVGLMQIGDMSQFLVGDMCESLVPTFDELVKLQLIAEEDAKCLYIFSEVEYAMFVLAGAAILLNVLTSSITSAACRCIEEREMRTLNIPKAHQRPNERHMGAVILLTVLPFGFFRFKNTDDEDRMVPHCMYGFEELIEEETSARCYFNTLTGETNTELPELGERCSIVAKNPMHRLP